MEPKIINQFEDRKKQGRQRRRPSTEKPKTAPSVKEVLFDAMLKRILQALQDEPNGVPKDEIERRLELGKREGDLFRRAFTHLHDAGTIAKTATGFKRGSNPWGDSTGGIRLD